MEVPIHLLGTGYKDLALEQMYILEDSSLLPRMQEYWKEHGLYVLQLEMRGLPTSP